MANNITMILLPICEWGWYVICWYLIDLLISSLIFDWLGDIWLIWWSYLPSVSVGALWYGDSGPSLKRFCIIVSIVVGIILVIVISNWGYLMIWGGLSVFFQQLCLRRHFWRNMIVIVVILVPSLISLLPPSLSSSENQIRFGRHGNIQSESFIEISRWLDDNY